MVELTPRTHKANNGLDLTLATKRFAKDDAFRSCLRLKVWDVDAQRMVGVRGL